MAHHVGKNEFGRIVEAALAELPPAIARHLERVPVEVRDRPTPKELKSVGLGRRDLLLGLYVGTSLADESVHHALEMPSVIFLFQEDLELVSDSPQQLQDEIRKTVLHEVGHHFGLDENDLDELGYG
ncbi:MAG TPA: metallopeptidase family protein [Tepidisphaeraceae bacterium]|jgi:predicted Zn-dependent protease with MMP-like domain